MAQPTPSRRWLFAALRVGLAAGILAYLFSRVSPAQVLATVGQVGPARWMTAAFISLSGQVVIAYRLRLLTDAQRLGISTAKLLEINLSAVFFGLLVPAGNVARGAIRVYGMARPTGKFAEAVASILFDRLSATLAMAAIALLCYQLAAPPAGARAAGLFLAASTTAALLLHFLLFSRLAAGWWRSVLALLPWRWLRERAERLRESASRLRELPRATLALVFALAAVTQLMSILAYYTLAGGLGIELRFIEMAWVMGVVRLLIMIPISPAGLGVREGALVVLLGQYGVPGEAALALSLLAFATGEVLVGIVGGVIEGVRFLRGAAVSRTVRR
ncbi:MAG: lysylphosphatidylglycerol synthase transmembrane domain-containing protein [Gemmatimonadaceae bacterium]